MHSIVQIFATFAKSRKEGKKQQAETNNEG